MERLPIRKLYNDIIQHAYIIWRVLFCFSEFNGLDLRPCCPRWYLQHLLEGNVTPILVLEVIKWSLSVKMDIACVLVKATIT